MKKNARAIVALAVLALAAAGLYFMFKDKGAGPKDPTGTVTTEDFWFSAAPPLASANATDTAAQTQSETQTETQTAATTPAASLTAVLPPTQPPRNPPATAPPAGSGGWAYAGVYEGIAPAVAVVPANPYLIYVSRDFALPANYSPSTAVCVPGDANAIALEATAAAQYRLMYNAAKATGATLVPYSGYRNIARQKANFERKISEWQSKGNSHTQSILLAAQSIQPPGCSEHNAGLAMDITRPGYWDTREDFDTTREFAWLQAHGHEYGFILRYPKGMEQMTQVKYEPWHWRYVGVEAASAMHASGQVLEEYLGLV